MSDTPQYKKVVENLEVLQERLKVNRQASQDLEVKFKMEGWVGISAQIGAQQLAILALNRIKYDVNQYNVFLKMLRGITGMEDIAKKIAGIFLTSHAYINFQTTWLLHILAS